MIGCDRQKKTCQDKCREGSERLRRQAEKMREYGYSEEEIRKLIAPAEAILRKTREEIEIYQRLHRKDISALYELKPEQLLIGLRVFRGMSRSRLAEALGMRRDELLHLENNEYSGISLEMYHQIIAALGLQQFPVFVLGSPGDARELRRSLQEQSAAECGAWFVGL